MAEGGFFSKADVDGYAPVVVLGTTVTKILFPDGEDPLGKYILVQNVPFEVVGILASKGATSFGRDQDDVVFVPLSTGYMRLFGNQFVSSISVKVADSGTIDSTRSEEQTSELQ